MKLLSEYLESIAHAPGMYIGKETPSTLETFVVGFASASPIDYHEYINKRVPGPKGISSFETFDEAFDEAISRAKHAEAVYEFDSEAVRNATFDTEGLKERLKPYKSNLGRHKDNRK